MSRFIIHDGLRVEDVDFPMTLLFFYFLKAALARGVDSTPLRPRIDREATDLYPLSDNGDNNIPGARGHRHKTQRSCRTIRVTWRHGR